MSYVPSTPAQRQEMLQAVGVRDFRELYRDVPEEMLLDRELDLPSAMSELEVSRTVSAMAAENTLFSTILRGAGAYDHYIPALVKSVPAKEEFLTAYTPYQAEMSQGVLQSIFEYQTMICELTGMEVSNASVYDGATAAAEAAAMCRDRKRRVTLISGAVHPDAVNTVRTYCFGTGDELRVVPTKDGKTDPEALREMLSPDVAVGEGQPLGLPLGFGGPYLGFMATTQKHMRKLPGRIVGETVDAKGQRAYVLSLQAREQHIRREKASSNICSNEALCALTASVYLACMGPAGLREAAEQCMAKSHYLMRGLTALEGVKLVYDGPFFHEFVTTLPKREEVLAALEQNGILGGLPVEGGVLWCATEKQSRVELDKAIAVVKEVLAK